eukprot:COSAG03_NODE_10893_length_623_cov_1.372137_1_plen_87_part_10
MRDRMTQELHATLVMMQTIASISVAWSLLAGGMGLLQWVAGAPHSPYYLSCLWYATAGGIISIVQLLSITACNGSIRKQEYVLQEQL